MQPEVVASVIVGIFLLLYAILGAIDFGASFWSMVYLRHHTKAGEVANRFLSPTWEVTNTFLVLLVVSFVGFYPGAAFILGTVLLVPVSIVLVLISIRSALMVFAYSTDRFRKMLRIVSGIAGLLVPMLLISVLPVTQGSFIAVKKEVEMLLLGEWLSSVSTYFYMLFGLTSELFLSSLFLADYAREAAQEQTYQRYRRNAIFIGPITLISAILTLAVLEPESQWLLENIQKQSAFFAISIIFYLIGYSALWWQNVKNKSRGKPRIAVLAVVVQYMIASYAYAAAHMPYIVYPSMTLSDGFTNVATFRALVWVFAFGLALLIPGFYLFWRLFLKDRRYLQQGSK